MPVFRTPHSQPSMKRSASATVRRTVRRAVTWRPKTRPAEPIQIRQLISPLRYDVQIRADFFALVASQPRDLPLEELVGQVGKTAYARWFRDVAMARYRPWVLKDSSLLEQQFALRVRTGRALYWDMLEQGFDVRHPVVLRQNRRAMLSESGPLIAPRLHVGDGSHRMAFLLMRTGWLEPEQFLVDPRPSPIIDNTVRLFSPDQADSAPYLRFVAARWVDADVRSAADLVEAVGSGCGAAAAAEAESVLRSHRLQWGLSAEVGRG